MGAAVMGAAVMGHYTLPQVEDVIKAVGETAAY
jgi:hypothetical protein